MSFAHEYLQLLSYLANTFGQNETLPLLIDELKEEPSTADKHLAAVLRETDRALLKARDSSCLKRFVDSVPGVKLYKMFKAMTTQERVVFWVLLDRVVLLAFETQKERDDTVQSAMAKMNLNQSSILVVAFNKLLAGLVERLAKIFGDSTELQKLHATFLDLDPGSKRFVEAMLKEISTDEEIEMFRTRDPRLLAKLVTSFPGVDLPALYKSLHEIERENLWRDLDQVFSMIIVQKPIDDIMPSMEQATKAAIERALRNNIDPMNTKQITSHIMADVIQRQGAGQFVSKLQDSMKDASKVQEMQTFLKLKGFGHLDVAAAMRGDKVCQADAQRLVDQLQAMDPNSKTLLQGIMEGLAGTSRPDDAEEEKA